MKTDTISDMLTRIRNANLVRHQIVQIEKTKMNLAILNLLKSEGFIGDFEELNINGKTSFLVCLKYNEKSRKPVINCIKQISKPGLRIYVKKKNLPTVLGNLGCAIVSTSQGVMTNKKAASLGIGGEIICYIW